MHVPLTSWTTQQWFDDPSLSSVLLLLLLLVQRWNDVIEAVCNCAATFDQGLYTPWKVLELKCWDFQAWKVLEKDIGPGKPWKSPGILK